MLTYLIPDPKLGKAIESANQAKMNLCWTCHSCNTECPINIATNRLQPLKIVHMANLGLLDQLVSLPEIWYCLSCNRCNTICPMTVKPAAVIGYLREQVARRKLVSYDTLCRFRDLFARFQQVRWHMASRCLNGRITAVTASPWYQWLETPV
jgi:heterodisulfide reductase subunit C